MTDFAVVADCVARPFLKWAGGKGRLLVELRKHVPEKFGRYYEPFVGAGALFFDLAASRGAALGATISDSNEELISAYTALRFHLDDTIAWLRRYEVEYRRRGDAFYYELRARDPQVGTPWLCAARMIALNKTCFNGLYRVAKKGGFNVPVGKFASPPTICDEPNLRAVSAALKGTKILAASFDDETPKTTWLYAKKGDFCYADPPYWPVSDTANFVGYQGKGFGPEDQEKLRDLALRMKKKGVFVLLSNADVPQVRKLYGKGFEMRRVEALRAINSKASGRGPTGELIIY